jgi:arsenate reductase (glutaredoxin)
MKLEVPQPPHVTLWHNDDCSKSRRAQELLAMTDCEIELYDYLADPPSVERLQELLVWLGKPAEAIARTKEAAWSELGLAEADGATILEALSRQPALIQRPIAVVAANHEAVIGRPPEMVLKLLIPKLPKGMDPNELMRMAMQGKLPT